MTTNRKTKTSLLVSVLAMLLCVAMLAGSTLAWFTDSAATGVNKIEAGNLDVKLSSKTVDTYTEVKNDTLLFMKDALWEPGHVEVVNLKIENAGSLALRYRLGINVPREVIGTNAEGDTIKLSDFLQFAVIDGEKTYTSDQRAQALADAEAANPVSLSAFAPDEDAVLYPAGKETAEIPSFRYVTLVVYMPTTVGNEANYRGGTAPRIDLGVKLEADQTPFEFDSFSNDYDAPTEPDPFAVADAAAAAEGKHYRNGAGEYVQLNVSDQQDLLVDTAYRGGEATLVTDIGAPTNSNSSRQADYSNKQSVLDLNGHTYTFGELELQQNFGTVSENSSLVVKDGTMVGSINFEDILKSYNAMQSVTLENVHMKWGNPLAWDAKKPNYYGLNLATKSNGAVFAVTDCTLDCNAKFYVNADCSAVANITNTTVNGQLCGQGLTMNVDGCTVNGEVYCNASGYSKTTVNISNSTINGNAFFDAATTKPTNDVTIKDTVINGDLQTKSTRNNVHITLTDVTVTGTLSYSDSSWNVPASKVTIVSGRFGFDPTAYLASGSTVTHDAAANVWVVTAH